MVFTCAPRLFWCSREVSPTAARDRRPFRVVKVGFGRREITLSLGESELRLIQKSNCTPSFAKRAGIIDNGVSHDVPKVC